MAEYKRQIVIQSGAIYVPAWWAGTENEVLMCAMYDGVSILNEDGHRFYPLDWLEREFQTEEHQKSFAWLRERVRKSDEEHNAEEKTNDSH
jgi:hypothetical protein